MGVWEAGGWEEPELERVLATVLFTDIVGASERAAKLGDRAWRQLLERHHELVRRQLIRFRGREVDTAGDGFFASFDGPARAIGCACAIVETMAELDLEVRAGLHTGECELVDGKVAGIAVHTGARVAAAAAPGEVLVSSTVKDLVAGSGTQFEDRGVDIDVYELARPGALVADRLLEPEPPQAAEPAAGQDPGDRRERHRQGFGDLGCGEPQLAQLDDRLDTLDRRAIRDLARSR